MNDTLTVRDLLLPGEPLDPAEVLAGEISLDNPVSWVVSLRPFPPAFPRMRGGEFALVATEHLARLEPPTTLSDVVRLLASRGATGIAIRGEADERSLAAAEERGMPLVLLQPDAPLHDIEQAIMRVCALYQARREMLPAEEPGAWVGDLLSGRITTVAEAHSIARRRGTRLANSYAVAFIPGARQDDDLEAHGQALQRLEARLDREAKSGSAPPLFEPWEGGLAVLLPQGTCAQALEVLSAAGLASGIGHDRPLLEAPASLEEARLAAIASSFMCDRRPVHYDDLGPDRVLLLLYRDRPTELRAFVEDTLGPLLRYDQSAPAPLLPTLAAYVSHGGKLRETAGDIYVHRNTLSYRLDRAAELLDVDLKDPRARLAIELALRALPLVS